MYRGEIIRKLKDFKDHYSTQYGIVAMGIFGSLARNEATEASDVDIVVQTITPDPFIVVHLKDDLEKKLHQRVDIVRLRDTMNPSLKKRIEAEAVYV